MKKCSECEKELKTSLDEFGDQSYPLCRSCFLNDRKDYYEDLSDHISEVGKLKKWEENSAKK